MKKTEARRKTMVISQPIPENKKDTLNQTVASTSTARLKASKSQMKASTPTHDKTTRTESPDVSHIMPNEISPVDTGGDFISEKPAPVPASKAVEDLDKLSLEDQIDVVYSRYLQTMFKRKLTERAASEVDDKLTVLQKRVVENQNILEKTTERLKNINFNIEVEALQKLQNTNYGRVLETLDNVNCKEYLETMNKKLEQRRNQLRFKNIELPEGGGAELFQIVKDTVAACENMTVNNNLEVPKVLSEIETGNNATCEALSRCLKLVPEVENLIIERAALEVSAKYDD